jgi:transposase
MDTEIQALPENVDDLQRLLRELLATTTALRCDVATKDGALEATLRELASEREENLRLREQVRLYLQKKFGSSSEKLSKDQLQIFNEAELLAEPDKLEDEEETSADESSADNSATNDPARPRRKKGRRPLPQSLPRRDVVHDLAPEEKICPHDGHELRRIGEEVSEQLEYIPGTVEVIRNIRPKYACPSCEECVRIGPLPPQPIPKSMAAPGLLAQIAVAKYCDALPLYRQSNIFERVGIDLSRTTMANWMIQLGDLVQPVINLLRDELLDGDLVQCDETSCQVLKEPGKSAQTLSYLWAQRGGSSETPIILFDYDRSRSSEVPKRLLEEFKGFLQTDGYKGYDAVVAESHGLIIRVGCMAHVRRKFDEAIKAQSGGKKSQKEKRGATKAHQGFAFVQKLYRIETKIRGQSAEVRRSVRQAEAIPILEEMKEWLDETKQQVPPRSLTGMAISYTLHLWESLKQYVKDGRLEIDNNAVENAIRPFVLGRKNWLFADTVRGAEASANLYSLIETAKANRLEPYRYLRHLFAELPKADTVERIEQLLPTRWKPQESSSENGT